MRIPVVLMIVLLIGSILIDLYITNDIKKSTKRSLWWKVYGVSAILCWIFIIVTLCLPRRSESNDILPIMWMLYSYLTVYAAKLIYILFSLIGRIIRLFVHAEYPYHPLRWVGAFAACALFFSMWWGVGVTRHQIEVNCVDISSPKIPESFNGYRIAQLSDLHVGTWGNDTTFISNLVDSVNALKPDLIVFTGDIVNRKTAELKPFIPVLSRLHAKDGVLSILGNHDYGDYMDWNKPEERTENNKLLADYEKKMGWDLLNNRKVFMARQNDSIMVVGVENVGDPPFPTYGNLDTALSPSCDSTYHQNDSRFKVLLTHNPAHWRNYVAENTNFDLTLSGHTHAMQMVLRFGNKSWSPAEFRYPEWGGMYQRFNKNGQATPLYVNIGAGEVAMPMRLFAAYPEITLFILHHKAQ